MFVHDWKKDVFTIPNFLSLTRLLLIPVYISIYLNATGIREYYLAGGILILSTATDLVDGQIARRFNMISQFGKFLDPLADKLTQLALIVCLCVKYSPLRLVLLIFLAKEIFQFLTALVMFRNGKVLPGAIPAGKICTAVLFAGSILLVMIPDLNGTVIRIIAWADSLFLLYAFVSYFFAFYGTDSKLQDFQP